MTNYYPNTNYGSREPEQVEHLDGLTVLNANIKEHTTEEGETYWTADATQMTNEEYVAYLEQQLAVIRTANDEAFLALDADVCACLDWIEEHSTEGNA